MSRANPPVEGRVHAVVLSGGGSSRMGADKATVSLDGRSLLQHVLDGLADLEVVVVGPSVTVQHRRVTFVRESPVGSGPAAALASGADEARGRGADVIVVVATDMPYAPAIARRAAVRLLAAERVVGGVLPIDDAGFAQYLCAAYRVEALADAAAAHSSLAGLSVRTLVADLAAERWRPGVGSSALVDLDTPEDLFRARERARR